MDKIRKEILQGIYYYIEVYFSADKIKQQEAADSYLKKIRQDELMESEINNKYFDNLNKTNEQIIEEIAKEHKIEKYTLVQSIHFRSIVEKWFRDNLNKAIDGFTLKLREMGFESEDAIGCKYIAALLIMNLLKS